MKEFSAKHKHPHTVTNPFFDADLLAVLDPKP
jgi:hypothetical protein